MDEDLFELAKDNDLSLDEAQEVQDLADELGVDVDDAYEIWQEQQGSTEKRRTQRPAVSTK